MTLLEWMVQATALGALFGGAAVLLERLPVQRRWVWLAAALLSVLVPGLALLAPAVWPEWLSWRVAPSVVEAAVSAGAGDGVMSPGARGTGVDPVVTAWAALSVLCLLWHGAGWARLRRLSRGCVPARVAQRDVLLSERLGPAVVGLKRPRVVAPRWILSVGAARQRMIVLHEAEHLRAGDHWLLAIVPLLVLLLPWNPALWWQVRRLRLAVELDCDARVLSRGVRPLAYGGLLLDVAGSGVTWAAPALAESRSALARRLEAVAHHGRRPNAMQGSALASVAAAAVLSGCLVAAPVRTLATPTVASSETSGTFPRATAIAEADQGDDAAAAHSDDVLGHQAARRAAGAVVRVAASTQPRRTRREPVGVPVNEAATGAVTGADGAARFDNGDFSRNVTPRPVPNEAPQGPLIIVDGVILTNGRISELQLDPNAIESIEVLKGVAAEERYGARGADGVLTITTRRGGGR